MSELKRCPFCGGEHIDSTYFNWCPAIMCTDCGAVMTVPMDWSRNREEELERKWNTRIPMQNIVERLKEKKTDAFERLFDGGSRGIGFCEAIKIVKEEGGGIV